MPRLHPHYLAIAATVALAACNDSSEIEGAVEDITVTLDSDRTMAVGDFAALSGSSHVPAGVSERATLQVLDTNIVELSTAAFMLSPGDTLRNIDEAAIRVRLGSNEDHTIGVDVQCVGIGQSQVTYGPDDFEDKLATVTITCVDPDDIEDTTTGGEPGGSSGSDSTGEATTGGITDDLGGSDTGGGEPFGVTVIDVPGLIDLNHVAAVPDARNVDNEVPPDGDNRDETTVAIRGNGQLGVLDLETGDAQLQPATGLDVVAVESPAGSPFPTILVPFSGFSDFSNGTALDPFTPENWLIAPGLGRPEHVSASVDGSGRLTVVDRDADDIKVLLPNAGTTALELEYTIPAALIDGFSVDPISAAVTLHDGTTVVMATDATSALMQVDDASGTPSIELIEADLPGGLAADLKIAGDVVVYGFNDGFDSGVVAFGLDWEAPTVASFIAEDTFVASVDARVEADGIEVAVFTDAGLSLLTFSDVGDFGGEVQIPAEEFLGSECTVAVDATFVADMVVGGCFNESAVIIIQPGSR